MKPYYLKLAQTILGVKDLPVSLVTKLDEADEMLCRVGGNLTSRQVIVAIILQWELEQTLDGFERKHSDANS